MKREAETTKRLERYDSKFREGTNIEYLKNVLLKYIETQDEALISVFSSVLETNRDDCTPRSRACRHHGPNSEPSLEAACFECVLDAVCVVIHDLVVIPVAVIEEAWACAVRTCA